jgi:hypothetical protein
LAAFALAGCTAVRYLPPDPFRIDAFRPRERVYVAPDSGRPWFGDFFRLEADTLILFSGDGKRRLTLDHIDSVGVSRFSPRRTVEAALWVGAAWATVAVLFATGILESVDEDKGPVGPVDKP